MSEALVQAIADRLRDEERPVLKTPLSQGAAYAVAWEALGISGVGFVRGLPDGGQYHYLLTEAEPGEEYKLYRMSGEATSV